MTNFFVVKEDLLSILKPHFKTEKKLTMVNLGNWSKDILVSCFGHKIDYQNDDDHRRIVIFENPNKSMQTDCAIDNTQKT